MQHSLVNLNGVKFEFISFKKKLKKKQQQRDFEILT